MILNVTITDTDEGERFKVLTGEDERTLEDRTDDYEIVAVSMPDGRTGWMVLERDKTAGNDEQNPT